jgi:chromosome segregation ATPase
MPARATVTTRVRGGASRARGAGEASLERLTQSVEAAQAALKDLRKELSKGSRDVLGDLDMTLSDARKSVRRVRRTVTKDLEEIQQALTAGKPARTRTGGPRKRAAAAGTARKRTTSPKTPTARATKQRDLP